jgi:anthranilate phosphoribosyltransferase
MKHVGPARKKMGKKTIFNLIGPLSSPAQVKRQVIGVFDKKWMKPFRGSVKGKQCSSCIYCS